ncbi:hypothetical protein [Ruminiclostridium papyrosolvens]|uniref:Uncharacterized protein n=1 Tax=Ruminiclostridium papyrosolvens C7 TaxID=1330534 RepID=U4QXV0_9FIRM|nr:hypothetical protein [Ruminiclostridium papyrosolvens]EPR07737.1 hypothetical protein L323_19640 [Ruminiclostridium papyrosolvens C7]
MIKRRSKLIIITIIFVALISAIINSMPDKSTDMSKLIEKTLSKQYKDKTKIGIFDTYEVLDYKIAGFIEVGSDKCGFSVLKQDINSRFELISVNRFDRLMKRALDTYIQYIDLKDEKYELGFERYLVILSMNPELSRIKMTVDDGKPIYKEIKSTPSLTVLKYPIEATNAEYLFYDKAGKLLR